MASDGGRVVITGAEVVTCLGASRAETWRGVVAGRCGMRTLTAMESPLPPDKLGGQAVDLPGDYEPGSPREVRYLKWTIERALAEAGALEALPYDGGRCGFMLGTTLHGMRAGGEFLRSGDHAPLGKFLAGHTLAQAAGKLGISGLAATTCSACSSSLGSVALGVTLLKNREFDLVVCGGYDTISEYAYGGFNSLRLVAEGPLRPFGKDRQGMKLGEGYGIVILERLEGARRRGATVLAEVLGYGESADAHHLTQPHPDGDGAARAMAAALAAARVGPAEIGLIAAHATGTPDNDAAEYKALARVFGDELPRVPVVGFKSHLGHTLGGAGAVEMVLAMEAMREQTVPPCASVTADDAEFADLRLSVGPATPAKIGATLSTSLGFGGANTCVVLGPAPKVEAPAVHGRGKVGGEAARERGRDVFITGVGVVVPGAVGNEAFLARLAAAGAPAWDQLGGAIPEEQYIHLLNARRVRRMSEQVKLQLAATAVACADAGIADVPAFAAQCGAVLGSTHGSTQYSVTYYGEIVRQGVVGANPMLFAEGVPNASSAHLSLMLGVKGACQTIIGTRTAGLDALRLAAARIAGGEWERAIVGAAEEHAPLIEEAYRHCGLCATGGPSAAFGGTGGFVAGSAAVALILEGGDALRARGGTARGRVLAGAGARRVAADDPTGAYRRVLERLGAARHVLTSANGTWVDRAELAAVRRCGAGGAVVGSVYGHAPEAFSAGPLVGLAGAALAGRMPKLVGGGPGDGGDVVAATGAETPEGVVALCTDYCDGSVSGVRMGLGGG
jgi:3-oxoacyl-[acyl-carrier-protein] synthase II